MSPPSFAGSVGDISQQAQLASAIEHGDLLFVKRLYPTLIGPASSSHLDTIRQLAAQAIRQKQNHIVAYFLDFLPARGQPARPPLSLANVAVESSNLGAIELLAEFGYNFTYSDGRSPSAVRLATKLGNVRALKKIFNLRPNDSCHGELEFAITECKLKPAKYLFELFIEQSGFQQPPPVDGAELGSIKTPVDFGADPNSRGHRIARLLETRLGKSMLQEDPSLRAHRVDNWLPISTSDRSEKGSLNVLSLLLSYEAELKLSAGSTPLHKSARLGNLDTMALLLDCGAPVGARDCEGFTPLLRACQFAKRHAFELLLSAGSDVNARTKQAKSGLHLAARSSSVPIIGRLLDLGLQVGQADELGRTAFHEAAIRLEPDVINLLITRLANKGEQWAAVASCINLADSSGWTALHHAVDRSNFYAWPEAELAAKMQAIDLLLRNGADANAADRQGYRPVHLLFRRHLKNSAILFKLLEYGADPDARATGGVTPVMSTVLSRLERRPIAAVRIDEPFGLLAATGADMNAGDDDGNTALHYAWRLADCEPMLGLLGAGADMGVRNRCGQSVDMVAMQHMMLATRKTFASLEQSFWPLKYKLIELDAAGLLDRRYATQYGQLYDDDKQSNRRVACKAELELFKTIRLRPAVSLYDWLTSQRLEEPLYARDRRLVDQLKSVAAMAKHRHWHYENIINACLLDDERKFKFIERAKSALDRLLSLARLQLPGEIQEKILAPCSYTELRVFVSQIDQIKGA